MPAPGKPREREREKEREKEREEEGVDAGGELTENRIIALRAINVRWNGALVSISINRARRLGGGTSWSRRDEGQTGDG